MKIPNIFKRKKTSPANTPPDFASAQKFQKELDNAFTEVVEDGSYFSAEDLGEYMPPIMGLVKGKKAQIFRANGFLGIRSIEPDSQTGKHEILLKNEYSVLQPRGEYFIVRGKDHRWLGIMDNSLKEVLPQKYFYFQVIHRYHIAIGTTFEGVDVVRLTTGRSHRFPGEYSVHIPYVYKKEDGVVHTGEQNVVLLNSKNDAASSTNIKIFVDEAKIDWKVCDEVIKEEGSVEL